MRLGTLKRRGRDGTLVVATGDGGVAPVEGWPTLQAALDDWDDALPALAAAAAGRRANTRATRISQPRCHAHGSGSTDRPSPRTAR